MNITFLLISVERSGGVRVTVEIANQLAKLNHQCRIIVAGHNEIPFSVHQDVQVIRAQCIMNPSNFGMLSRVIAIAKAIPGDSDIVVASYYLTAYSAMISRLVVRNAKLYYLIQGYEPNYFKQKNGRIKWMSYLLARFSYYFPLNKTAISEWLSDLLSKHGHMSIPVINNGIDSGIFINGAIKESTNEIVVMTVANRRPNRGFYDFCAAISVIGMSRTDFKVLVIGADPDVANVLKVPYEFFTPQSDEELVAAYHKSTIYVSCSHEEGFGLTPLEAMSCGTPVVCTDSGGIREYARGGENCLLVPVRDINKIAAAITQLMDNDVLRNKLLVQGHRTASQFEWAVIGRKYEELFLKTKKQ